MGKKKEITPQMAVSQWKEIVERSELSNLRNTNGVIIGINTAGKLVILVPDDQLLQLLLAETEDQLILYDRDDSLTVDYLPWFDYGLQVNESGWLDYDGQKLFDGEAIVINLGEDRPKNYLSKDSLPLKLKKAEFTDIAYRVFMDEKILAIKKRFELLPEYGFVVVKLYKII